MICHFASKVRNFFHEVNKESLTTKKVAYSQHSLHPHGNTDLKLCYPTQLLSAATCIHIILTAAFSCCVPPELKLTLEIVMVSPALELILMQPFLPVPGSVVSPQFCIRSHTFSKSSEMCVSLPAYLISLTPDCLPRESTLKLPV